MENKLTYHAASRLSERTSLSEEAFLDLVRLRRTVIVGVEPFTNRVHKLFYSRADSAHFVGVQDISTGEMITVLPLEYHENLAWKIPPERLSEAILRASPELYASLHKQKDEKAPGLRCDIIVILGSRGLRATRLGFGSHRFKEQPESPEDALCDTVFVEKLLKKFRERSVPLAAVEEILLSNVRSHFLLRLPWLVLEQFSE